MNKWKRFKKIMTGVSRQLCAGNEVGILRGQFSDHVYMAASVPPILEVSDLIRRNNDNSFAEG